MNTPTTPLPTLAAAQADMRDGYLHGACGVAASSAVWAVAGAVALAGSAPQAVLALLVGGMAIHPLAVLLCKAAGRRGAHTPGNPLAGLALETTVQLLLGCALAWAVSRYRLDWFFPAMLLVIGGRYLSFATLYGTRLYWLGGGVIAAAGLALALAGALAVVGAFAGAGLEAALAAVLFKAARRAA